MAIDVVIPALGESITEATVGEWLKKPGEAVNADEPIVSLETDKVAVEVPAPSAGVLSEQLAAVGDTVNVGAVIARLEAGKGAAPAKAAAKSAEPAPAKAAAPAPSGAKQSPAVTVALAETGVDAASVQGTGKDGRLTKGDVRSAATAPAAAASAPAAGTRQEERVRMTRLRQTIARRLKEAQNTAAMLTTFNDVDMTAVMEARDRYKDMFEKKHGVRLGFMSFFTKACCLALKDVPSVNAAIEGDEIVYRNYADIGVAVSSPGGLVVPILRNADALSFAETEKAIGDFGRRARDGQLKIDELQGGTFTISNGGVFGSLLSTPILNPPQSGVLGMHRIEERPVVRDGQIVVRPMMYLALSYDHRLIDGREAVTFLVRVKEALEDPTRLVLDL
ncbi:2-oxoglutarate dehydrogenase complex dihydrolipoyllysine-residue succinyltransferase [Sphingosinicella soli]|uniref:Dihydrolipoyllysine-residue succinyltransferase component of 2-oxoglutarate dehydrogenase complex n=1 Tax=Sphingosinicella soli TaxID=333708 RepID=A0A7W7F655_9SPHN|nr:2-oxoglutarate dehydrogenase complex dihydrolipoyllysine-residue succinyltransferase [Sphingosinicella soli]MBB4631207.1 2-oxoglutarate dehydrogenase E2 component (dihydrolipoamide succinyltransferase) [Sphingosinicella soli]